MELQARKIHLTGHGILPVPMLVSLDAVPDSRDYNTVQVVNGSAEKGVDTTIRLICISPNTLTDERIKGILKSYTDNKQWLGWWRLAEDRDFDVTVELTYYVDTKVRAPSLEIAQQRAENLEPGSDFEIDSYELEYPDDYRVTHVEEL